MSIDVNYFFFSFKELLKYVPFAVGITLLSILFGTTIGIVAAWIRTFDIKAFRWAVGFYVSFVRTTPLLLHIYMIYYGLPLLIDGLAAQVGLNWRSQSIPNIVFVIAALSLNAGAYLAEIIRSGMMAVRKGDLEAAYAIGMTTFQAMRRIVLPQAFMHSLPNLCTEFVVLLHGSSLAFFFSIIEITGKAKLLAADNWKYMETFLAAAAVYWILTVLIERGTSLLERKTSVFLKGGVT